MTLKCSNCGWLVYRWQNITKLGWKWDGQFNCPTHAIDKYGGKDA